MSATCTAAPAASAPSTNDRSECPTGEHGAVLIVTYVVPRGVEPATHQQPSEVDPTPNFAERQGPNFLLWMGLTVFLSAGVAGLTGHWTTALIAGTAGVATVALSVRIRYIRELKVEILKLLRIAARFRSSDSDEPTS
jgi:hypothetical protein